MMGSLALWYEPSHPAKSGEEISRPEVELHFNLWRDLPTWINWLDVGFFLSKTSSLSRFYLFVPAQLDPSYVSDLSRQLKVGNTLNAVFNDVVVLGAEADTHYQVTRRGGEPFSIFHLEDGDLDIEEWHESEKLSGTRIVFTEKFCSKLNGVNTKRQYVRLRIALVGAAADLFSSEVQSGDKLFQAAVDKLELTEFRLNERRNYPRRIAELADDNDFRITTVHYFLIRNLSHQLLEQHAPFRKVRRLEPDLWTSYLASGDSAKVSALGPSLVSRFVIYHWRADAQDQKNIEDFVAFASFKTSTAGLLVYALVILLLGAAGNFLAGILMDVLPEFLSPNSVFPETWDSHLRTACVNAGLLALLLVIVMLIATLVSLAEQQKRWARELLRSSKLKLKEFYRRWHKRKAIDEC